MVTKQTLHSRGASREAQMRQTNHPSSHQLWSNKSLSDDLSQNMLQKPSEQQQGQRPDRSPMSYRWREFGMIYLTYMCFLMARKNYGFWLPSVLSELGRGKGEAGLLGSTFEMSYGTFALVNGVLIDMMSPKYILVLALVLISLVNLGVAASSSLSTMVFLWGCNGFAQSFGWPSITTVFLAWFPDPASRGAWYSLLSTCQNVGAALVPLVVSFTMSRWGWKTALYTPSVICSVVGVLMVLILYGSPAAVRQSMSGERRRVVPKTPPNLGRMLSEQVVCNPLLWYMGANYFGVSMVRTCLSDWTSVFLMESKGMTLATAARCLFLMEIGGFGGSLAAGALSDRLFAGRRGPVVCVCTLLLTPSLIGLLTLQNTLLIQLCYLCLGMCAFPVHVLLGLFAREVVGGAVSSSAGGFVKCIAQIGGAFAGYPLGKLQQYGGWEGVFAALVVVAFASAAVALPLWSTTAQNRINARNGTVGDFKSMKSVSSFQSMSNLQAMVIGGTSPKKLR